MKDVFVVAVEGIDRLPIGEDWSERMNLAMVRSLNEAARAGRKLSQEAIEHQVNFPAGYLDPRTKRLVVGKQARRGDLEASIDARFRPTSLARFVQGTPARGEKITVNVNGNRASFGRRAFLFKLRAGANTDTKSNLGLAIRLKPGESLKGKREAVKMRNGLYLLYGPSVSQVFFKTRDDVSPDIADRLVDEFNRLFDLDDL